MKFVNSSIVNRQFVLFGDELEFVSILEEVPQNVEEDLQVLLLREGRGLAARRLLGDPHVRVLLPSTEDLAVGTPLPKALGAFYMYTL